VVNVQPVTDAVLRLASPDDAASIAAIYRPIVEHTAISFETDPPDGDEMRRRIASTLPDYPWLVCECDGTAAGYAYAGRMRPRAAYRWSVETSAYVDERYRGRGIGHGLYLSLFAILAAQGYVSAYAGISLPNPASIALHERVGFRPLGTYHRVGFKMGRWHDVGWWERPIRAIEGEPSPTLTVTSLTENAEWPALLATGLAVISRGPGTHDAAAGTQ
jgi:L-amino acid N-acyltransferase YncA